MKSCRENESNRLGQNEYRWNDSYPGANACEKQNGPQPDGAIRGSHGRQEGARADRQSMLTRFDMGLASDRPTDLQLLPSK